MPASPAKPPPMASALTIQNGTAIPNGTLASLTLQVASSASGNLAVQLYNASEVLNDGTDVSPTVLGGVIGLVFLKDVSGPWIGAALAHAGGGFFFLACHAVLGEIWKHHKALVLTCFGAGFAAIGLFTWLLRSI